MLIKNETAYDFSIPYAAKDLAKRLNTCAGLYPWEGPKECEIFDDAESAEILVIS